MKIRKSLFAKSLASSVCVAALLTGHAGAALAAKAVTFNIAAVDLADALNQFALQSDRQIVVASALAVGREAQPLHGTYDTQEALNALLRDSGLAHRISTDGTIIIFQDQGTQRLKGSSQNPIRVAAAQTQSAATAAPNSAAAAPVEEVVVTGSRIVREGYEAPTPLTVVGAEQLQTNANAGLIEYLNTIPALTGTTTGATNTSGVTSGFAGGSAANLRALGNTRTLVLLDGQRLVGAEYHGYPNISAIPQQLIERVDVVTGGASAVYGSDAVAGVVNFILNKKFTGVKGEISGGMTNYSDDRNYKIDLTAGLGFGPDDRGHLLLSAELNHNQGIRNSGGRKWDIEPSYFQIVNPNYSATNGQPQQLLLEHVAISGALPGGIITSGPLKGTAFGPGGVPFKYNYGPIVSFPYSQGDDWALNNRRSFQDLDPDQTIYNIFTQASYDITDNISAHVQYNWNEFKTWHNDNQYYDPTSATSPVIKLDNAFLPTSVRDAMIANGMTQFSLGTDLGDLGYFGSNNMYIGNRINGGLEGKFDALDTTWKWQADYLYASTKANNRTFPGVVNSLFLQSTDAVVSPTTGQIVCRVTRDSPNSAAGQTCKPWNILGTGVNTGRPVSFTRPNFLYQLIELEAYNGSITGEPFSLWAGPVSIAASFEHRWNGNRSVIDTQSSTPDRLQGVNQSVNGAQSVTEGALETLIPLATNESWAQNWDLSLATRFTSYELSGNVTTWKVGTTFAPIDDVKFRLTRSRDIRAPNMFELFVTPGAVTGTTIIDKENGSSYPIRSGSVGNPSLEPEKADTTGIGIVLAPRFLDGFTASVDYWDVDIGGAIRSLSGQQIEDTCFETKAANACNAIMRDPTTHLITAINAQPINLAVQDMRGLDIEATYRRPLSALFSDWDGDLSLHGLMTVYLRNYQDDKLNPPTNHVGEVGSPPFWKATVTATYALDPFVFSLTGRAVSHTRINSEYIECTSGCPASTSAHNTINNNRVAGRAYIDANFTYKFNVGANTQSEFFLSVRNILNNDPPVNLPSSLYSSQVGSYTLFDQLGTVYRAGIRFKI